MLDAQAADSFRALPGLRRGARGRPIPGLPLVAYAVLVQPTPVPLIAYLQRRLRDTRVPPCFWRIDSRDTYYEVLRFGLAVSEGALNRILGNWPRNPLLLETQPWPPGSVLQTAEDRYFSLRQKV